MKIYRITTKQAQLTDVDTPHTPKDLTSDNFTTTLHWYCKNSAAGGYSYGAGTISDVPAGGGTRTIINYPIPSGFKLIIPMPTNRVNLGSYYPIDYAQLVGLLFKPDSTLNTIKIYDDTTEVYSKSNVAKVRNLMENTEFIEVETTLKVETTISSGYGGYVHLGAYLVKA